MSARHHRLQADGAPAIFNAAGNRMGYDRADRDGPGCGECGCGETSEPLPDRAARVAWHRAHRDALEARHTETAIEDEPCSFPDKQRHPDQAAAVAHHRSLRHRDGAFTVQAYRCPAKHATHWHVGHRPYQSRKGRRRR